MGKKKGGKGKAEAAGEGFTVEEPVAPPPAEDSAGEEEAPAAPAEVAAASSSAADEAAPSAPSPPPTADEAAAAAAAPVKELLPPWAKPETTRVVDMQYCGVCKCPYEFCEWGPLLPKCKEKITASWDELFPEWGGEEKRLEIMTRWGLEGKADSNAKKAQSAKKPAEGGGDGDKLLPGGKKKEKVKAQVVIELNTRNKKKHITVVRGLEHFGVDTSAAAKVFGKKFACGSALQKGKNGIPDQIEIQGNCFEVLPEFILEKFKDIAIEDVVSKEGK